MKRKIDLLSCFCCLLANEKNNLFQRFLLVGLLFFMPLCFVVLGNAQTNFASFLNRSDFNAVSSNLSTIDFESVAPARGFGKYPASQGLTVGSAAFRTSGGGKFGAGMILVLSESYALTNPMYNTGTGAVLAWGPPNQTGNAYLDVTLPGGVYAVGADLLTGQPVVSTVDIIATTSDGKTQSVTVNTQQRPNSSFGSFVSDKEITSVRFQIPKGQSWLFLDNFTYGRKREGANLNLTASAAPSRSEGKQNTNQSEAQMTRPKTSMEKLAPKSAAVKSVAPREQSNNQSSTNDKNNGPASDAGSIAYMRSGKEIRLIAPDGTNDRRIWTHERATQAIGINELAWRPDGKELAFSSGHDAIVSLYHADIYVIKPDGTGLRKITNAPNHSELARFPKGSVTVTVRNQQPIYRQSSASAGVFIIYVAGADEPQQITLPPGASRTLVFKSVADFGDHAQPIVALMGRNRWFIPGTDVKAGQMTKAPDFGISGDGITLFGAFRPVWRSDGSRISYRSGLCTVNFVSADHKVGPVFNPLFGENSPSGTCAWDWGPTQALANQIIYQAGPSTDWSIYRGTEGGKHPGEKIFGWGEDELEFLQDLRWLPDGSGFIFSSSPSLLDFPAGNISLVNLATKKRTLLTDFKDHLIGQMSVSPDGRWIAFERVATHDAKTADIWIVGTDGKNLRLLVKDGWNPTWSK